MENNMQHNNALEVVPNWNLEPNQVTEPEIITEPNTITYGNGIAWDTPVHKEPVYFNDGSQNPMVYGIRLGHENKLLAGNVSSDYKLVDNRELVDVCVGEILGQSGIEFSHHYRFFNNKGIFRDIYYADNTIEGHVPVVGDTVRLVAEIVNSYNGSTRAGIRFYFQRLECLNGMTSNKYGFGYMFKHSGQGSFNWQEQIMRATSILRGSAQSQLNAFVQNCGKLQKPVDNTDIALIRKNYLNKLPMQQFGQLIDKFLADEDYTAWGLMNAGTNVLWHPDPKNPKRLTNANFSNNTIVVDGLLQYATDTYDGDTVDPNQTEMFQS